MSIPKMMKAAVVDKFREPLSIREVSVPALLRGEVLIEIVASGVCHTWRSSIGAIATAVILLSAQRVSLRFVGRTSTCSSRPHAESNRIHRRQT
jgi:hypothetical protein